MNIAAKGRGATSGTRRFARRAAPARSANKTRHPPGVPGTRPHAHPHVRCCCSECPLLLMGALIVGLQIGEDELRAAASPPTPRQPAATGRRRRRTREPAARGVRLQRIGTFDDPVLRDCAARRQAPRVRRRAERAHPLLLGGKRVRRPFLDLRATSPPAASRACSSMAFAPDYARSGRFYVYFTDRSGDERVQEFRRSRGSPNRADKSTRRPVLFDGRPVPEPQRRACCCSAPTAYLYIGTGDGGSGGDPENRAQNLDSLLGKILRIDPRAQRLEPLPLAALEPVRGPRRARRDLRLRAAQPLALLVRPPHRRPLHRRRRPGRARGDRLRAAAAARAGATTAGAASRASSRFDDSRSCPSATPPMLEYGRGGRRMLRHGRRGRARPGRCPALAGRYVYGDYCAGPLRSFRVRGGRATDDRGPACGSRSSARSARTRAGGCTPTSLNGPVYRLRAR